MRRDDAVGVVRTMGTQCLAGEEALILLIALVAAVSPEQKEAQRTGTQRSKSGQVNLSTGAVSALLTLASGVGGTA